MTAPPSSIHLTVLTIIISPPSLCNSANSLQSLSANTTSSLLSSLMSVAISAPSSPSISLVPSLQIQRTHSSYPLSATPKLLSPLLSLQNYLSPVFLLSISLQSISQCINHHHLTIHQRRRSTQATIDPRPSPLPTPSMPIT